MQRFKLFAAPAIALILSLALAATVAANNNHAPTGLTAELCGSAVCLSWTPGTGDYNHQEIWYSEHIDDASPSSGHWVTDDDSSAAEIPLYFLTMTKQRPFQNRDRVFTFQAVSVQGSVFNRIIAGHSNEVTLFIPRPSMEAAPQPPPPPAPTPTPTPAPPAPTPAPAPPAVPADHPDPSGLHAELCEAGVCLTWTPGHGDYTYQEVRFWKTGDPDNFNFGGGRIVNTKDSQWQFTREQMNRHPSYDGDLSYTFQVSAVKRHYGKYAYVGKSNTVVLTVPTH